LKILYKFLLLIIRLCKMPEVRENLPWLALILGLAVLSQAMSIFGALLPIVQ